MEKKSTNLATLSNILERVISTVWVIPILMVFFALILSFAVFFLNSSLMSLIRGTLFKYETARTILVTLSSLLLAILSIDLSIIIILLSTSSNLIGPRLLKNILKHSKVQFCFGFFIASFVFCVTSLLLIRWDEVYLLSLIGAIIAVVISAFVLIYLVEYVRKSIQIDSLIESIIDDAIKSIKMHFIKSTDASPGLTDRDIQDRLIKQMDGKEEIVVVADFRGYIQTIDYDKLFDIAVEHDLLIEMLYRPGQFIWNNLSIAKMWGNVKEEKASLVKSILNCFSVGIDRTSLQDVGYCFEQLAEIAVRSLSPSLANPFTAINALNRMFYGITFMACYSFPPSIYRDEKTDRIYLIVKPQTFEEVLTTCFDRVAQDAAKDFLMVRRILEGINQMLGIERCQKLRDPLITFASDLYQQSLFEIKSNLIKKKLSIVYEMLE